MHLQEFLKERKAIVLDKWISAVLATYPADSSRFLAKQKDRFANPLGFSVTQGLADLLDLLSSEDAPRDKASSLVEQLVKLRAVQDFTPSAAVAFVYALKPIVVELHRKEGGTDWPLDEWLLFEDRVDGLALMVFDLYMTSREMIFKVRLKELTSGNYLVADRMECSASLVRRQQSPRNEVEKSSK